MILGILCVHVTDHLCSELDEIMTRFLSVSLDIISSTLFTFKVTKAVIWLHMQQAVLG